MDCTIPNDFPPLDLGRPFPVQRSSEAGSLQTLAFVSTEKCTLRKHLVTTHHATFEVVGDMTVEEPDSFIVRHHVRCRHRHRSEEDRIHSHLVPDSRVSVPVSHVDIILVRAREQIPANTLTLPHGQQGNVPFGVAVDGVERVLLCQPGIQSPGAESPGLLPRITFEEPAIGLVINSKIGTSNSGIFRRSGMKVYCCKFRIFKNFFWNYPL